jgi:RHS repeat-associated protein
MIFDGLARKVGRLLGNGGSTTIVFDPGGNQTNIHNRKAGGSPVSINTYTYDKTGHKRTCTETTGSNVAVTTWSYDSAYQLINEKRAVSTAGGPFTLVFDTTYSYDPVGNRTLTTDISGAVTTSTYSDADRKIKKVSPLGTTTYTHDTAGNRTEKQSPFQTTYYSFDARGLMVTANPPAGIVTLTYNGDRQRVNKQSTDGSTWGFVYDHMNLLERTDGDGATDTSYTAMIDEPHGDLLSEYSAENGELDHQFDASFNVQALLDSSGNAIAPLRYTAFGLNQNAGLDGWSGMTLDDWDQMTVDDWAELPLDPSTNFGAGGQKQYYADPEIELYLLGGGNGGRYYDPEEGRFITEDPIRQAAGEQTLFNYVGNDPVNKIDPSGHGREDLFDERPLFWEALTLAANEKKAELGAYSPLDLYKLYDDEHWKRPQDKYINDYRKRVNEFQALLQQQNMWNLAKMAAAREIPWDVLEIGKLDALVRQHPNEPFVRDLAKRMAASDHLPAYDFDSLYEGDPNNQLVHDYKRRVHAWVDLLEGRYRNEHNAPTADDKGNAAYSLGPLRLYAWTPQLRERGNVFGLTSPHKLIERWWRPQFHDDDIDAASMTPSGLIRVEGTAKGRASVLGRSDRSNLMMGPGIREDRSERRDFIRYVDPWDGKIYTEEEASARVAAQQREAARLAAAQAYYQRTGPQIGPMPVWMQQMEAEVHQIEALYKMKEADAEHAYGRRSIYPEVNEFFRRIDEVRAKHQNWEEIRHMSWEEWWQHFFAVPHEGIPFFHDIVGALGGFARGPGPEEGPSAYLMTGRPNRPPVEPARIESVEGKLREIEPGKVEKPLEPSQKARELLEPLEHIFEIRSEGGNVIGRFKRGESLEIISKEKELHGGNVILLKRDATTTVTGTLKDVGTVATRGEQHRGMTEMGENKGGINILRSPKWREIQTKYDAIRRAGDEPKFWELVTDEFWNTVNKPWLDEAIARGDAFRLVSNPNDPLALHVTVNGTPIRIGGKMVRSIFGREVDYLTSKGYSINPDGTVVKR